MFRPFTRVLTVGVLAVGATLFGTPPAQAQLGLTIDPTHGVPGNIVDGTVDTDDIAANCPADPTPLMTAAYNTAYFIIADQDFVQEIWGPGCTDINACPTDTYDELGVLAVGNTLVGIALNVFGATDIAFPQTFALAFADIVTQAVQGTPGTFDKDTGLGTVEVPDIAPGVWAVAAACVLPLPDIPVPPNAVPPSPADHARLLAAVQNAGQLAQDAGLPAEFLTIADPEFVDFLMEKGSEILLPLMVPTALGVQLFTIDQTCSDASECQDGDVCNGLEECNFDSTAGAFICQDGDAVTCSGVSAKKLIIVDKLTAAGKAKTVFVAKDAGATKGAGNDVEQISVDFKAAYDSTSGAFLIPAGSANGWKVNKDTVAKYVNKDAPGGPTEAKVAVMKPGKLLKLVGKGLGDDPIDLIAEGAPTGSVFTRYLVANAGEQNAMCTEFAAVECKFHEIAAGTGRKLVCKNGVADPSCAAGD